MNDYSNLLDRVYELEGLLHLAVNRSNPPASLDSLIRRKAAEITACLGQIDEPLEVAAADDEVAVADDNDSAESVDAADVDSPAEEFDTENDSTEYVDDYADDYEYADSEVFDDENVDSDNASDSDIPRKFSFSINDRFRFRRTLFNNSDREFNIAIASISACHDYQEAEQMLQEDYGWNTEDVEPSDFLRLVSNYFKYQR